MSDSDFDALIGSVLEKAAGRPTDQDTIIPIEAPPSSDDEWWRRFLVTMEERTGEKWGEGTYLGRRVVLRPAGWNR